MVDSSMQSKNLYKSKARNLLFMMRDLANLRKEVCGMVRYLSIELALGDECQGYLFIGRSPRIIGKYECRAWIP